MHADRNLVTGTANAVETQLESNSQQDSLMHQTFRLTLDKIKNNRKINFDYVLAEYAKYLGTLYFDHDY